MTRHLERLADQIRGRVLVAGGEYVNDQTDDDTKRVNAAYDENYDWLISVKNEWGP